MAVDVENNFSPGIIIVINIIKFIIIIILIVNIKVILSYSSVVGRKRNIQEIIDGYYYY